MPQRKTRGESAPSPLAAIANEIRAVNDPKELDLLSAAIEFERGLRALGPMPAALRSVDDADPCFFSEAVLDLEDLADRGSDELRQLMHSITPAPGAPDPMAVLVAVAAYGLWHSARRDEDSDIIQVADSAGLEPRELRWAIRFARLTASRLQDNHPSAYVAYLQAFETVIRTLTKGFIGRDGFSKQACKTPDATCSIEELIG